MWVAIERDEDEARCGKRFDFRLDGLFRMLDDERTNNPVSDATSNVFTATNQNDVHAGRPGIMEPSNFLDARSVPVSDFLVLRVESFYFLMTVQERWFRLRDTSSRFDRDGIFHFSTPRATLP